MREGGARSQETGPRTGRGEGPRGGYPTTEGMGCIGGGTAGKGRGRARKREVEEEEEEEEERGRVGSSVRRRGWRQGVAEKERQS